MKMVYGNDFADVANRELSMDSARDARYFQSLAAARARQQQQLAAAQAQASNQLSWQQLLAQSAANAQRNQEAAQEFDFRRGQAGQDYGFRLKQFDANQAAQAASEDNARQHLELARRQVDNQTSPDRKSTEAEKSAMAALTSGMADAMPAADLAKLYPNMNSEGVARLMALATGRNDSLKMGDTSAENAAATYTDELRSNQRKLMASDVIDKKGKDVSIPDWYLADNPAVGNWASFGKNRTPGRADVNNFQNYFKAAILRGEFDKQLPSPDPTVTAAIQMKAEQDPVLRGRSRFDPASATFRSIPRYPLPALPAQQSQKFVPGATYSQGGKLYRFDGTAFVELK